MSAIILNGSELAKSMRQEIEADIQAFVKAHGYAPTAAIVRAGDDPASVSYSNALEKALGGRGLGFQLHTLPGTASQKEIVNLVAGSIASHLLHSVYHVGFQVIRKSENSARGHCRPQPMRDRNTGTKS